MSTPERQPGGAPDKKALWKMIKDLLGQVLRRKKFEAIKKRGEEAYQKKLAEETVEAREREEERRRREEEQRAYRQRKTVKEEAASVEEARRAVNTQKVVRLLREVVAQRKEPEGAGYLVEGLRRDAHLLDQTVSLIEASPEAAVILEHFLQQDSSLHGDAPQLLKLGQRLLYAAEKAGKRTEALPLLSALSQRVKELVVEATPLVRSLAKKEGVAEPRAAEWLLEKDPGIVATPEEEAILKDPSRWGEAIESLLFSPREEKDEARWTEVRSPSGPVYPEVLAKIDDIWGEVERREKAGEPLSPEELREIDRQLYEAESAGFPRDVQPGTKAYFEAVKRIRESTEEKHRALAEKLAERLRQERPRVKRGITSKKEFLAEMAKHPGYLGPLFRENPEMERLLISPTEEGRRFRDQVFLTIHSAVLTQRREASHDNFGLYERADFVTFNNLLRNRMASLIRPETGLSFGQSWVDWYTGLSNTIRLSRDIDYWASQPDANIETFSRSLAMYQNEYNEQAMTIPGVEQAFRALELTLRSIKDANDGYIPPGLIEYSGAKMRSFWDNAAADVLRQMISLGAVKEVERDRFGFHQVEADGHTVRLSNKPLTLEEDPQGLELAMYMTLAKGFGMASARLLEIFATSKIPGSDHPTLGMEQFHSIPYEGVARALNFFSTFVHKWKIGAYKYFWLVNQLIPEGSKRLPWQLNESNEAFRAYAAYRDGTFAQKYGEEAKRFIDSTNICKVSSAIGRHTTWRQFDSTLLWSDKERERLGLSTRIVLSGRYAEAAVKELLVEGRFREEFREKMKQVGQPYVGAAFEKLWQEQGRGIYRRQIDEEWERLSGKTKKGKRVPHGRLEQRKNELTESYQKAFKARAWVEAAMRNPLVVAHALKVEVPIPGGYGQKRSLKLHSKLVQQILGIPLEDTKYGEIGCRVAPYTTPTEKQEEYMREVLFLEADLAAVREIAIEENRDLTEQDFDIIQEPTRRAHALAYWRGVKEMILGSRSADELYREFGLPLGEDGESYQVNWSQIEKIEGNLSRAGPKLKEAVETEMEWMYGTDDISFRRMDMLNLGSRHWVRRGGDIMAHWNGGNKLVEYMNYHLVENPDVNDLAKALLEVRKAYEGDMIEAGWAMVGNFAHLTNKLYSFDLRKMASSAQADVWKKRRNVASWKANDRLKFFDALEHLDVLPPQAYFYYYHDNETYNIDDLRNLGHANTSDVMLEVVMGVIALAALMTLWRALTARDEEKEG